MKTSLIAEGPLDLLIVDGRRVASVALAAVCRRVERAVHGKVPKTFVLGSEATGVLGGFSRAADSPEQTKALFVGNFGGLDPRLWKLLTQKVATQCKEARILSDDPSVVWTAASGSIKPLFPGVDPSISMATVFLSWMSARSCDTVSAELLNAALDGGTLYGPISSAVATRRFEFIKLCIESLGDEESLAGSAVRSLKLISGLKELNSAVLGGIGDGRTSFQLLSPYLLQSGHLYALISNLSAEKTLVYRGNVETPEPSELAGFKPAGIKFRYENGNAKILSVDGGVLRKAARILAESWFSGAWQKCVKLS